MPFAEVFLSAFLGVLFQKLASPKLWKFARRENIDKQLHKWKKMLSTIQAVILDAEEKQITDNAVKMWLDDLQDLADDLDDIVDELATEAFKCSLMTESQASSSTTSKVRKLIIPTFCTNFTPSAFMFDRKMVSKMRDITARLQGLADRKNNLNLTEQHVGGRRVIEERLPTTSSVDESRVYGREADKVAILNLLLGDETCVDNQVCVIPIVGMGGLGKTTLAQLVYNNEKVKGSFNMRVWVCVSEEFDVLAITKTIFQYVTEESCDSKSLDMLQVRLRQELSNKKFLLVLDDVWNTNYEKWDILRRSFQVGVLGSKVIVTTRNDIVALTVNPNIQPYNMKVLTNEDCLSVLAFHAFERSNFDAHPDLKVIGEGIVRRCKGLPLAAKALGGLLRTKSSVKDWEDVLKDNIWDLPECGILPALRLSYYHLPAHLKNLFTYCAIFPKDYELDRDDLILLWMGEGLLPPPQSREKEKQMEDLGYKCFHDLLSRSFFQPSSSSDKSSKFVMHDLMHDLAQSIAGERCYRLEGNEGNKISDKARHFSYIPQLFEVYQRFAAFSEVNRLRTFLPVTAAIIRWFYLSNRVLHDLLPKLHYLRVLSLANYKVSELPDSIGDLKHLRYLNLSNTPIKCVPEPVSTLYNLQTLLLQSCGYLNKLPSCVGNLVNLRHLDNSCTSKLEAMPLGIGKLTCLQTLTEYVVSKSGSGLGLGELRDLSLLRGTISIYGLQNVRDVREAKDANMMHKQYLNELELQWLWGHQCRNENLETDVLDQLRPHTNLKSIGIYSYGGMRFPSWMGDPSFSKMVEISLVGCKKCPSLPPLGQLPMLKELYIGSMHSVKSVGAEFYGDGCLFPSLEILRFYDMPEWVKWSCCLTEVAAAVGQFHHLRELHILECPKLLMVPLLSLPSLQTLELQSCDKVILKSFGDLTSLTSLKINRIKGLCHLDEEVLRLSEMTTLEKLEIGCCDELVTLWQNSNNNGGGVLVQRLLIGLRYLIVSDCPQLVSLGGEEQGLPFNLDYLDISRCDNLEKLSKSIMNSLGELNIKKCPKLVCFPEIFDLPMLRYLEIEECAALESLPNGMSRIEKLVTNKCPKLVCLPEIPQLSMLRYLEIMECAALEFLPNGMSRIEILVTNKCPNLKYYLPTTSLKILKVRDCTQLEYSVVSEEKMLLQDCIESLEELTIKKWGNLKKLLGGSVPNFTNLVNLCIWNCDGIESFPQAGGLSTPNLRDLDISSCGNLKYLTDDIQSLTSLHTLRVTNCGHLESIPEGNFPPNLMEIDMRNFNKLKPPSQWGLHRLTSLRTLRIKRVYPKLVSFPAADNGVFSPSLTTFEIEGFSNLESLSSLGNLPSLRELDINSCPNLQSLPNTNMLATLSSLRINKCPLLEKRCLNKKGDYWSSIVHIPYMRIDERRIDEQSS